MMRWVIRAMEGVITVIIIIIIIIIIIVNLYYCYWPAPGSEHGYRHLPTMERRHQAGTIPIKSQDADEKTSLAF